MYWLKHIHVAFQLHFFLLIFILILNVTINSGQLFSRFGLLTHYYYFCFCRVMASLWTDFLTFCLRSEISTMKHCSRNGPWCSGELNRTTTALFLMLVNQCGCVMQWHLCFLCWNRDIFEQDNYSPIPVENEEEYKAVVSRFPFHDAEIEKVCQTLKNAILAN